MPEYVASFVATYAWAAGDLAYAAVYAAAYVATVAAISYGIAALSQQGSVGQRQDSGQLLEIQVRSDSPRQIFSGVSFFAPKARREQAAGLKSLP